MIAPIDIQAVMECVVGLALADHVGDVNNELPKLVAALGLEPGEWSDEFERFVFPWEEAVL